MLPTISLVLRKQRVNQRNRDGSMGRQLKTLIVRVRFPQCCVFNDQVAVRSMSDPSEQGDSRVSNKPPSKSVAHASSKGCNPSNHKFEFSDRQHSDTDEGGSGYLNTSDHNVRKRCVLTSSWSKHHRKMIMVKRERPSNKQLSGVGDICLSCYMSLPRCIHAF
jgi:hypothetical protein